MVASRRPIQLPNTNNYAIGRNDLIISFFFFKECGEPVNVVSASPRIQRSHGNHHSVRADYRHLNLISRTAFKQRKRRRMWVTTPEQIQRFVLVPLQIQASDDKHITLLTRTLCCTTRIYCTGARQSTSSQYLQLSFNKPPCREFMSLLLSV